MLSDGLLLGLPLSDGLLLGLPLGLPLSDHGLLLGLALSEGLAETDGLSLGLALSESEGPEGHVLSSCAASGSNTAFGSESNG